MTMLSGDSLGADLADDLAAAALSLARSFYSGATMWVVSPQWPPHAHHVAVEFVHPVIVGKRALPSVALTGADPVARARVATRPGDVLILIAEAGDPIATDLARRAPAWGVKTFWIGFGPRPAPGAADHVCWVTSADPMVPATGEFVLIYHLLWELTHVCFEHPGLLSEPAPQCEQGCVTCSDEGRLAEVVQVPVEQFGEAVVRTPDGEEAVDITLVGEVSIGDLILIHAGSALTVVP